MVRWSGQCKRRYAGECKGTELDLTSRIEAGQGSDQGHADRLREIFNHPLSRAGARSGSRCGNRNSGKRRLSSTGKPCPTAPPGSSGSILVWMRTMMALRDAWHHNGSQGPLKCRYRECKAAVCHEPRPHRHGNPRVVRRQYTATLEPVETSGKLVAGLAVSLWQ
jgi:hypothetical protein